MKQWRTIINSPDAILWHDGKTILSVSLSALRLFHVNHPSELVDTPILDIIDREFAELIKLRVQIIRQRPLNEVMPIIEYHFIRRDGTTFWAKSQTRRISKDIIESRLFHVVEDYG